MISAIAFSVYPVKDLARARRFYEQVLCLRVDHEACDGHWIEYDIAGATFVITDMNPQSVAGNGGAVAFEVDDFDAEIRSLNDAAVHFIHAAFETPVCRMAVVADPDGNELIIHKRK